MKPHPRRGFYRPQRWGPALSKLKTVWIKPVFVNKRLLGGDAGPAPKDYRVR